MDVLGVNTIQHALDNHVTLPSDPFSITSQPIQPPIVGKGAEDPKKDKSIGRSPENLYNTSNVLKEYGIDQLIFAPREVNYLEIWQYQHEEPTIRKGNLHENTLKIWLKQDPPQKRGLDPLGGCRMLFCTVPKPDYTGRVQLPVSRIGFRDIISNLKLSPDFVAPLVRRESCFNYEVTDESLYQIIHCDHLQGIRRDLSNAITYDPALNITTSLTVQVCQQNEEFILPNPLIEKAQLSHLPLLMPILVLKRSMDHVNVMNCAQQSKVAQLMIEIGQHPYENMLGITAKVDPLTLPFVKLTTEVNRCIGVLHILQKRYDIQIHFAQRMSDSIVELQESSSEISATSQFGLKQLKMKLNNMRSVSTIRLHHVLESQRACQTQLSVLYSFMAQKDNKLNIEVARDSRKIAAASRQDSSAMKTIAVLTILFLPGTFISTLFAMPLFNWSGPSNSVVSGRFWVYWAFTIPLTILVMIVWAMWIYRKVLLQRKQDQEIDDQVIYQEPKFQNFSQDQSGTRYKETHIPVATQTMIIPGPNRTKDASSTSGTSGTPVAELSAA